DTQMRVTAPSDFVQGVSTVVIQISSLPQSPILSSIGIPSTKQSVVGNIVFDVKAIVNQTTVLDTFDEPVTITYQYADQDIEGMDESSLWLYHYHQNNWRALDDCHLNMTDNTITCTTPGFS